MLKTSTMQYKRQNITLCNVQLSDQDLYSLKFLFFEFSLNFSDNFSFLNERKIRIFKIFDVLKSAQFFLIISPDKVGATLDSARSRRRTDFLHHAITHKLFAIDLSNVGSYGGPLQAYCFVALAFNK